MQRAHEKILDALKENESLSMNELQDITGYKGISQRISELIDTYGYDIQKVKINGIYKYSLGNFNANDESDEEDIEFAVSPKRIKDAQEVISKYYKMIKLVKKDIPKVEKKEISLKKNNESLVILNSDWHIGKKTEENGREIYNTQIARQNLNKLFTNLRRLIHHILSSVELDEIVICNIGDLVDGECIYQGQIERIDEYLDKQIEIATREKYKQVTILQDEFGVPIREYYVVGNHGKGHQMYQGITNFDSLVHLNEQIIRDITDNTDLYICPNHQLKTRLFSIRGHRILMRHWAPPQTETSSAFRRYSGWLDIYNYDGMFTAHFHSPKISYFQKRPIIRNGSIVGDDDYSKELGYTSRPSQIVMGISNKRFPTFIYTLDIV